MNRLIVFTILLFTVTVGTIGAEEAVLSLTFAGDIMAHDINFSMSDFNEIYDDVRGALGGDDLSFGNLEFPVVEDRPFSGYPLFNVHQEYIRAAGRAGFDVFSLANNHTRDQGDLGMLKTLAALILLKEEAGGDIHYSGVRGDAGEPFAPRTIYKKGFKIGFLAATQFLNVKQAAPHAQVVDYLNKKDVERFVARVKEIAPSYDLLVLSYHGDVEYKLSPSPAKQIFFRALARAGVHIIWGHHPHVIQPYEWIEHEGSRRLIMYSLGNFVSGMAYYYRGRSVDAMRAYTGDSFLLNVRVERNAAGEAAVAAAAPLLITSFTAPPGKVVVRQLAPLAESLEPGHWRDFYSERLRLMNKFLLEMPSYLVKEIR